MAKREITICDRCGGDEGPHRSFFIITDRQCDPAGSMDDVGEVVDLCVQCLGFAFQHSINERNYAANKAVLKWAKGRNK